MEKEQCSVKVEKVGERAEGKVMKLQAWVGGQASGMPPSGLREAEVTGTASSTFLHATV